MRRWWVLVAVLTTMPGGAWGVIPEVEAAVARPVTSERVDASVATGDVSARVEIVNSDVETAARDLFAGDPSAVQQGTLLLPFQESDKELLRINEALGLRGAQIDALVADDMAQTRVVAVQPALSELLEMTLTVVDGNVDPAVLRDQNLTLTKHVMPRNRNRPEVCSDRPAGPTVWVSMSPPD